MFFFVYHGRKPGFYNDSLFMEHGVSILEDLVIILADGIASMYLELISVDSSISNEMNNLGLSLCTLSTRALQKLRNEVLNFSETTNTFFYLLIIDPLCIYTQFIFTWDCVFSFLYIRLCTKRVCLMVKEVGCKSMISGLNPSRYKKLDDFSYA